MTKLKEDCECYRIKENVTIEDCGDYERELDKILAKEINLLNHRAIARIAKAIAKAGIIKVKP